MGTREKIHTNDLERIYDIACQYNVGELRILSPVATGSWSGRPEKMLTAEEISYLQQFHRNHNRQKNGPCVATSAYIESADMFGCNAGYHHLFIDAAGEVCPCDLTPISFGNITTQPLKEIWENMKRYFPQPRNSCLMSEISNKITASSLPLPPSQSTHLIPQIEPHTPFPGIYRRIFK
jgi:MoaA/NifB/PqqE/SkfB family radical SAM enzyme